MNNILYEVNNSWTLPTCWLYKNRKYTLNSGKRGTLPQIRKSHETILKELGIPYRIVTYDYGEVCEYWNPEAYEEEKIMLPAYAKMPNGTYRYIKDYTGRVPTAYTISRALELKIKVKQAEYEYEKHEEEKESCQNLKGFLRGRNAAGIRHIPIEEKDFLFGEDHIKILPVIIPDRMGGNHYAGYCVVFDVNAIELNSIVTLEVPKGQEGLFVGTNGWQVKEWCQKLGLKAIKVVGI